MKKLINNALTILGLAAFCYVAASALAGAAHAQAVDCDRLAEYAFEVGKYQDSGANAAQAANQAASDGLSTDGAMAQLYAESAARFLYRDEVKDKPRVAAILVLKSSCEKVLRRQ